MSPALPPTATRIGGDPTPVPAEMTDGLLSGLIANENEAYFRKAKAASASSGDAAAAFHGGPHVLSPGSPTPPPEPPVLLRQSVEMDILDGVLAAQPKAVPLDEAVTNPTPTPSRVTVPPTPHDHTIPLPAPRPVWIDKTLAFGLAVLLVGTLGILVVRWTRGEREPAPKGVPTTRVAASPPPVEVPAPPPPLPVTAAPAAPPPVAEAAPSVTASAQPSRSKATHTAPATRSSTGGLSPTSASPPAPTEVVPPPKDDVKRSM